MICAELFQNCVLNLFKNAVASIVAIPCQDADSRLRKQKTTFYHIHTHFPKANDIRWEASFSNVNRERRMYVCAELFQNGVLNPFKNAVASIIAIPCQGADSRLWQSKTTLHHIHT